MNIIAIILTSIVLQMTQFKDCSYAVCSETVPFEVAIDCGHAVADASVSPHSRGIQPQIEGNMVHFTIKQYGQYVLNADGRRFLVFADAPTQAPEGVSIMDFKGIDPTGSTEITAAVQKAINESARKHRTLIFTEGTYLCRQLDLPSGSHIHLMKGATILADSGDYAYYDAHDDLKTKRFINIKGVKNVSITGSGAINGNGRALREQFGDKARMRLILACNSSDITVEGVMLQDPGSWNTQILKCSNVTFRNAKVMNDLDLSNTDGIDPDASSNVLIENCFASCSDDNVAIKTTGYSGYLDDLKGVTVRGCVFITRKSSLKVGTETRGDEMSDILFEDNDVLMSDRGMAIYVSDGAKVSNVVYRNNRFESYTEKGKMTAFEFEVKGRNEKSPVGSITGLVIEGCSFEGPFPKQSSIKNVGGTLEARFTNFTVGGKKISAAGDENIKIIDSKVIFE